jgi:hypothetical protein
VEGKRSGVVRNGIGSQRGGIGKLIQSHHFYTHNFKVKMRRKLLAAGLRPDLLEMGEELSKRP